jgi:hypothetical protein
LPIANGTLVLDALASTSTGIASHLHLLEHAWGELLLDDTDTMSTTYGTSINLAVGTARSFTSLANELSVPLELAAGPVVEVSKRNVKVQVDIVATGLS